jgi:hypothetical protein
LCCTMLVLFYACVVPCLFLFYACVVPCLFCFTLVLYHVCFVLRLSCTVVVFVLRLCCIALVLYFLCSVLVFLSSTWDQHDTERRSGKMSIRLQNNHGTTH